MAFIHGKNTFISLDGDDLSTFIKSSEFGRESDSHDVTAYGKDSKVYQGGLLDATFNMEGTYDNGASGPAAVIRPLVGTVVELIRRPAGTGTGLPQQTVDVLVNSYVETNPVDDMVTWSCDCQCSDDILDTTQS